MKENTFWEQTRVQELAKLGFPCLLKNTDSVIHMAKFRQTAELEYIRAIDVTDK